MAAADAIPEGLRGPHTSAGSRPSWLRIRSQYAAGKIDREEYLLGRDEYGNAGSTWRSSRLLTAGP
jgi:hypothetical protein